MDFIKKENFALHPEGLFRARLIDLIEVPSRKSNKRPRFKCTFLTEATTPGGNQMQIVYSVTQKLRSRSKFGRMVSAFGVDLDQIPDDPGLDTDDWINCDCCLEIAHKVRRNGSKKAKVTSVLPSSVAEITYPQRYGEEFEL